MTTGCTFLSQSGILLWSTFLKKSDLWNGSLFSNVLWEQSNTSFRSWNHLGTPWECSLNAFFIHFHKAGEWMERREVEEKGRTQLTPDSQVCQWWFLLLTSYWNKQRSWNSFLLALSADLALPLCQTHTFGCCISLWIWPCPLILMVLSH